MRGGWVVRSGPSRARPPARAVGPRSPPHRRVPPANSPGAGRRPCTFSPCGVRTQGRPDIALAYHAYSSRPIRRHVRRLGIRVVIPRPADRIAHRRRRPSVRYVPPEGAPCACPARPEAGRRRPGGGPGVRMCTHHCGASVRGAVPVSLLARSRRHGYFVHRIDRRACSAYPFDHSRAASAKPSPGRTDRRHPEAGEPADLLARGLGLGVPLLPGPLVERVTLTADLAGSTPTAHGPRPARARARPDRRRAGVPGRGGRLAGELCGPSTGARSTRRTGRRVRCLAARPVPA